MKKLAILIVAIAALSMFAASVSIANVPAPPVNQVLGFDDEVFNDWTASECALCHGNNTSDRHHFLYGGSMPAGLCSAVPLGDPAKDCYQDPDCAVATPICSNSGDPCVEDTDCPRQYQNPVCTTNPYCAGTSAAAKIDGSQNNDLVYGCLTCHEEETNGSVTNFLVERDCIVCHEQLPNSPSVHHLDEAVVGAKAGNCKFCHGNIVDDIGDGHIIRDYAPSNVTPEPATTDKGCSDAGYGPAIPCDSDSDCTQGSTGTCDGVVETCDTTVINDQVQCWFGSCNAEGIVTCTAPNGTVDSACDITESTCSVSGTACAVDADCSGTSTGTCDTVVIETGILCTFGYCGGDFVNGDTCTAPHNTVDPACDVTELQCSNGGAACTVDGDCTVSSGATCSNTGDACVIDDDCTVEGATCENIKADDARPGACNYCHDAGADIESGVAVIDNHDTHHGTGVYKDRYGNTFDDGVDRCSWCHYQGNPHNDGGYDPIAIRTCLGCHGQESLHSIQADSNGDGVINVGEEIAGYGHIGADDPLNPANGSDCSGCHGKVVAQSELGMINIAPTIDTTNAITTIVASTDAQVAITGNAFTSDDFTSTLKLIPDVAGNTVAINAITAESITATINAAPGVYALIADKEGIESNPIALVAVSAAIEAIITDLSCGDCKDGELTIDGSGFGAEIPAGVQSFMNVVQGGTELAIISWTDTQIVVSGYDCDGGPVTVNGLWGSVTQ